MPANFIVSSADIIVLTPQKRSKNFHLYKIIEIQESKFLVPFKSIYNGINDIRIFNSTVFNLVFC